MDLGSRAGIGLRLYFVRRCSCCLIDNMAFEYVISNRIKFDVQRSRAGLILSVAGISWVVSITLFGPFAKERQALLYRSHASSFISVAPISSKILLSAYVVISCVPIETNTLSCVVQVAGRHPRCTWLRKDGSHTKLSRDQILESVEGSLERLGTDYIDLLYLGDWPERSALPL